MEPKGVKREPGDNPACLFPCFVFLETDSQTHSVVEGGFEFLILLLYHLSAGVIGVCRHIRLFHTFFMTKRRIRKSQGCALSF